MGDKQRLYTFLEGEKLTQIDAKAGDMGVSRSELMRIAIEHYLTQNGDKDLTTKDQELTLLKKEIENLERMIGVKDGEIQHLRYLTNDLRSLADNLALKVPALPGPSQNESQYTDAKKKPLWMRLKFWTWV
jgi:hypothetical protein